MRRQKLIDFRGRRTQKQMGDIYGVSQQVWSCWENGISTPLPHIMKRLEIDIKIPMEEIFSDVFIPHIHKNTRAGDD